MANDAEYRDLPFNEAIAFFRQKLSIPTERWDDLWEGMHARGFMVAGATKHELLADFREAVDAAIATGESLAQFRRRFDSIVAKHGWDYNGGRKWRSEVIYATNVRTAYAAGRYAQMTDPDVRAAMPFWMYQHGDSANPRPLHLAWDGTVLPADHEWFKTHFAPNGWGCKCSIVPITRRDLARMGKSGPDAPPDDGAYTWTDRAGVTHTLPNGIDPGWAYNVGEAAYGRPLAQDVMRQWQAQGADAWERLTPGDWQAAARPERLPLDPSPHRLGPRLADASAQQRALAEMLGAEQRMFRPGGVPVLVDAKALAEHLDPARSPFLPFVEDVLDDPAEVWLSFERHRGTGRVEVRTRIVKAIDTGSAQQLLVVAQAHKGALEAWTFIPTRDARYLNRQRVGRLLYGR